MKASRPITISMEPDEGETGFLAPLAGGRLWSPIRWAGVLARPVDRPQEARFLVDSEWHVTYDGPGLDGGLERRVVSERSQRGQRRIVFSNGEVYIVAADGGAIVRATPALREETLVKEHALGAPLALALALRDIFLIHASAIALDGKVIALTAPSGGGKSTLAAHAAISQRAAWTRVADDVLPIRLGPAPLALPHFPQLKLDAAKQYPADSMASLPLVAVVELARGGGETALQLEAASATGAAVSLAAATVASRLFDPELLERHFSACASATRNLAVFRLRYPSGFRRIRDVLEKLAGLLA